tara:strand:- start:2860 stop:3042 length:183 start_codon:yes stop_codon:yes gene_type:complete
VFEQGFRRAANALEVPSEHAEGTVFFVFVLRSMNPSDDFVRGDEGAEAIVGQRVVVKTNP